MHFNLGTPKGVWLRILDIFFYETWKVKPTKVTGVRFLTEEHGKMVARIQTENICFFYKNNNCTAEIRSVSEIALDPTLHVTDMRVWDLQWMLFRERWFWQELIFGAHEHAKNHLLWFKIAVFSERKNKEWCRSSYFSF